MERFARRMDWMERSMARNPGWEDQYRVKVAKRERGWNKEGKVAEARTVAKK
jgi:hypothetical protein